MKTHWRISRRYHWTIWVGNYSPPKNAVVRHSYKSKWTWVQINTGRNFPCFKTQFLSPQHICGRYSHELYRNREWRMREKIFVAIVVLSKFHGDPANESFLSTRDSSYFWAWGIAAPIDILDQSLFKYKRRDKFGQSKTGWAITSYFN